MTDKSYLKILIKSYDLKNIMERKRLKQHIKWIDLFNLYEAVRQTFLSHIIKHGPDKRVKTQIPDVHSTASSQSVGIERKIIRALLARRQPAILRSFQ